MVKLYWGVTYFDNFSVYTYYQQYHSIGIGESFSLMWLNRGLSWNLTKIRTHTFLIVSVWGLERGSLPVRSENPKNFSFSLENLFRCYWSEGRLQATGPERWHLWLTGRSQRPSTPKWSSGRRRTPPSPSPPPWDRLLDDCAEFLPYLCGSWLGRVTAARPGRGGPHPAGTGPTGPTPINRMHETPIQS